MDVSLILKVVGIGLLVAVSSQILGKYGRDDMAMFVGISGIIVVLLMLVGPGQFPDSVLCYILVFPCFVLVMWRCLFDARPSF